MLPVARLGDTHVCPIHGSNTIIEGGTGKVDNKPVARMGDKTACGAVIIVGSSMGRDDGKPIAYVGCATSHGGVITTGSPTAKTLP